MVLYYLSMQTKLICFGNIEVCAYVPVDDFLSWPPVCHEKGETAVSEVTQ